MKPIKIKIQDYMKKRIAKKIRKYVCSACFKGTFDLIFVYYFMRIGGKSLTKRPHDARYSQQQVSKAYAKTTPKKIKVMHQGTTSIKPWGWKGLKKGGAK